MSKRFVIMGVAGFVAPRHLKAIHDGGHELVAAMDIHDSVGILDRYFPDCQFFTEFERFERFIDKEQRSSEKIDFLSVCTPNYLHDAHCRFGLRAGMNVICEKPLVLNPWNVDPLIITEQETGKRIANILQLRYHPELVDLKQEIALSESVHDVRLNYVTPRGPWYDISWKGDISKSGGIMTNIGVHLFDLLLWIFGEVKEIVSLTQSDNTARGVFQLEKANVTWTLSTNPLMLNNDQTSARSIKIDDRIITFDKGFENLHSLCYEQIINGNIIEVVTLKPLIQLLWKMRQSATSN